ncbi:MAG: ComEC/Rec2 family competence protein [Patescibacteria group bacterium]
MSRSAILCITFGFATGVFFRSFFNFGWAGIGLFVLLAIGALGQSFFPSTEKWHASPSTWRAAALFFLFVGLGVIRFEFKDQSEFAAALNWRDSTATLTGLIVSEPEERDERTRLVFQPDNWPIKILLLASPFPEFNYGDRLKISGRLLKIKNFQAEDTGRIVAYADYLAAAEIYYEMFEPKINLIAARQGWWWQEKLFDWKKVLLTRLAATVPEPETSLLAGLTVGARRSLGADWTEKFRRAGLLHLVVLSGYNLSIVAAAILAGLGFLSKRIRLLVAALAVVLFTLMVGAGPATIRACLMALIALLAQATGRRYLAGWALGAAGFLMLLVNPKVLVFDPGFQLSFLATAGLIYLAPPLAARLKFITAKLGLRDLVAITLAAQVAVLPWFLYHGATLPLLALPANLLVLPLVPAAMFFGFLTMLAGPLLPPLAWSAWFLADYILVIAKFFSGLF